MPIRAIPLIVCFGDSLTAGFQSPTPLCPEAVETPYGTLLQGRLRGRAQVRVSGVCGELTSEMAVRFERDALDCKPAYAVILGGTNDLGWNLPPQEIMRNLVEMYEQARAGGVQAITVTVPSVRGFDDHIPRRYELNAMIHEYCVGHSLPCVDLFTATAEPETHRLAARYSNDGLHLTTAGYDLLATLLYEEVFKDIPTLPSHL